VLECNNHLGEGPVWDVEEGAPTGSTARPALGNPSLFRYNPHSGKVETWSLKACGRWRLGPAQVSRMNSPITDTS